MPMIYMLHGFAGAGKTTFAKKLEREKRAVCFSHDAWMRERFGSNPPADKFADYHDIVTQEIRMEVAGRLSRGQDVILDFGFWRRADRDGWRAWAELVGADCVLYYLHADQAEMKRRVLLRTASLPEGQLVIDENALALFAERFEPLAADEPHTAIRTD